MTFTTRTRSSGASCRKPPRGGDGLERRRVARAREHDVRFGVRRVLLAQSHTDAPRCACARASSIVEPLELRLLVDDDEVHVVARPQAVIGDREQRVRVRRKIDARDRAALRQHHVDEPGPLMAEAVVIVAPAGRREQHVERRDRRAPREIVAPPRATWSAARSSTRETIANDS